jgi:drug/metabolite transporter (DMT)-like permease
MTGPSTGAGVPDRATLLAFLGVVLFGGINAIVAAQTLKELAPFWSAAMRFIAAGLIMLAIVAIRRGSLPRGRSLVGAAIYGAFAIAGFMGFLYQGLRETPAGTAMVLLALAPLMTFGLAIAHGQERFHIQGLVGALVAVGGIALVVADRLSANVPASSLLFVVLATACIAESGVVVKWIPRSDPFGTNAVAMLTGAVILLGLALVTREPLMIPAQAVTWASLAYLVVFGSVAMFALYLFALGRWTASAVSYMTLLIPLVSVPLSGLLTGERITPSLLAGGAIALVGVYVGAFLTDRPGRSSATSVPECLPIADCPVPVGERAASTTG